MYLSVLIDPAPRKSRVLGIARHLMAWFDFMPETAFEKPLSLSLYVFVM